MELVDDFDGDTYRAVYTERFGDAVLCFARLQEEVEAGRQDTAPDIDLVKRRLKDAEQDYAERSKKERK